MKCEVFGRNTKDDHGKMTMRYKRIRDIAGVALLFIIGLAGCGAEKSTFDETIVCNCLNDKRPSKTIPRWKYDKVRSEILAVLPVGETGMDYLKLREQVMAKFSKADAMHIGNLTWYVDTVTLHMETLNELVREADSKTPLPKHVHRNE